MPLLVASLFLFTPYITDVNGDVASVHVAPTACLFFFSQKGKVFPIWCEGLGAFTSP